MQSVVHPSDDIAGDATVGPLRHRVTFKIPCGTAPYTSVFVSGRVVITPIENLSNYFSEVTNNSVTVAARINTGISVTAYSPPYPTQSGSMSANPFGFSLESRPTGGTAWLVLHPGLEGSMTSSSAYKDALAHSLNLHGETFHELHADTRNVVCRTFKHISNAH
jgi:hypothetical protein